MTDEGKREEWRQFDEARSAGRETLHQWLLAGLDRIRVQAQELHRNVREFEAERLGLTFPAEWVEEQGRTES